MEPELKSPVLRDITDRPIRTGADVLDLLCWTIAEQRDRVVDARRREKEAGAGMDRGLSTEIKRLTAMIALFSEMQRAPAESVVGQPEGTGVISAMLAELAKVGPARRKKPRVN